MVADNPNWTVLKKRRNALGASLREIQEITGVPFSLLGKVEARIKPCPMKWAWALGEYYEAMLEDLFDSDGLAIRVCDMERDDNQLQLAFGGER